MPVWLLSKTTWIIGAVIIGLLGAGYLYHSIYQAGGNGAKLEQATAQIKQNEKAKIRHAKIAQGAPPASNRIARGMWVLQFSRSGQ